MSEGTNNRRGPGPRSGVTEEQFAAAWNAAENITEVVAATKMTKTAVTARANYYKTKKPGIHLKKLGRSPRMVTAK